MNKQVTMFKEHILDASMFSQMILRKQLKSLKLISLSISTFGRGSQSTHLASKFKDVKPQLCNSKEVLIHNIMESATTDKKCFLSLFHAWSHPYHARLEQGFSI